MELQVTNGSGLISIGMSDIGSYLSIGTPVSVVWHDCAGSIGEYCSLLSANQEANRKVAAAIMDNLEEDFTGREEALSELLKPLFTLFANGTYNLWFVNNRKKEMFTYYSSRDNPQVPRYKPLEIVFPPVSDNRNERKVQLAHASRVEEMRKNTRNYVPEIMYTTTGLMYDNWQAFIATRSESEIDQKRVRYFEERIRQGQRPFAIILCGDYDPDPNLNLDSRNYILDGHHKLLAYQKLNIYPPICLISYKPEQLSEIVFEGEQLAEKMYSWQIEHLLEHWDEREAYLTEKLKNPDSVLHRYIKTGFQTEYHSNGERKSEAFYVNGKIEGAFQEWYPNGRLMKTGEYRSQKPVGTWKEWYETGRLFRISNYVGNGNMPKSRFEYHENGNLQQQEEYSGYELHFIKRWDKNNQLILYRQRNSPNGVLEEIVNTQTNNERDYPRRSPSKKRPSYHNQPLDNTWLIIKIVLIALATLATIVVQFIK
jgi:hypothetical protein